MKPIITALAMFLLLNLFCIGVGENNVKIEPISDFDSCSQVILEEEKEVVKSYTESDINALSKLVWGEARGIKRKDQKSAVVWVVLNRVDSERFPDSIIEVITQKSQFNGYKESYPVDPEIKALVIDVLERWESEKAGIENGRVIPKEYLFFTGNGKENEFTINWNDSAKWDWSLESPYTEVNE